MRAVYFQFHKRRRLKGAFEEVFGVPITLRIGPCIAEEDELEVLPGHRRRDDTEYDLEVA